MTTIADLNRSLNRALSDIGQVKAAIRQLGDRVDNKPTGTGTTTITSGTTIHGSLTGLGLDDHMNLVHISNARTITAQHDFAPGSTQAPFTLGANAQDQLVTGLNADKLDGIDSTGFEIIATKAANLIHAGPTSGGAANPTYRSMVEDDVAQHNIISTHTVGGGAADDLVGLIGSTVLALLTPSDNPGAAKAILKTTTVGKLILQDLDINNDLNVNSTVLKVDGGLGSVSINKAPGAYDLDINDKLNVGGIVTLADDLIVNTDTLFVDKSQNNVGISKAPTSGYNLDVNTTLRTGGLATLSSLSVTGTAYFGNDLTVGPNILFVDYSGQRIGIKRAADPQFQLDILGNLRASGWIVGKHAVQLEGATGIFHFDGAEPYESDYTGVSTGHKGQVPTAEDNVIYRFGKFGKAIQSAVANTNLILNSSWETGDTTDWTNWGSPPTREVSLSESYYGSYSLRLITDGDNQGVSQTVSITNGQVYNLSIYTKVETGRSVLILDLTHGYAIAVSDADWTGDGEWHRMHIRFTAAASSIIIYMGKTSAGAAGEYFFDGCQLERYDSITPYCDGSLGNGHSFSGSSHASTSSRLATELEYAGSLAKTTRGTLMCWAKFGGDPAHSVYWEYLFQMTASTGRLAMLTPAGSGAAYLYDGAGASSGGSTIDDGEWHHVAVTWNGTTALLYLDGVLDITFSYSSFSGTISVIMVGVDSSTTLQINGWVDELAFLDRVATLDEITSVYESDAPVFAETSTFEWSTPSITTWVDEEGLWSRGQSGQEVLGVSDVDSKSWGGITLDEGDILIGNSPSFLWWDDSNSRLAITGKLIATSGPQLGGTVFQEIWDDSSSIDDWEVMDGTGELSVQPGGLTGGSFLRAGDNSGTDMIWLQYRYNIPFDQNKSYKITFRVRRTNGTGTVFAGVLSIGDDGTTYHDTAGGNGYSGFHRFAANAAAPGSSWTVYEGYFRGVSGNGTIGSRNDPTNPGSLNSNATYFRPVIIVNYDTTGITEVDMEVVEMLPWGEDLTEIDGGRINALSIDTGSLVATAIDGMTITGATIRTSSSGARVEMNSTRIFGTDGSTVQWEALNADGKFTAGAGNVILDANGIEILAVSSAVGDRISAINWTERDTPTNEIMYVDSYYNTSFGYYHGRISVNADTGTARSGYDATLSLSAVSEGESLLSLSALRGVGELAGASLRLYAESTTTARAVMSGEDFSGLIIHAGSPPTSDTPSGLLEVRGTLGEAWVGLSFGTNWTDLGGAYQVCEYKKHGDLVFVRGLATSGASAWSSYQAIGTLPGGYRPATRIAFHMLCAGGKSAEIDITTGGVITFVMSDGGSGSGFITLDGIVFSVD